MATNTLKDTKGIRTAHINTGNGGLLYHLDEVKRMLSNFSLDVLCISETWIDCAQDINEMNIDGYHLEHRDNNGTFMGKQGVAICNELGVCRGPISHNNEQTQSVEGII